MGRSLRRALAGVALLVGGVAACRVLLPDAWALNAPLGHLLFGWGRAAPSAAALAERIRVPEGFRIGLYAAVPDARLLRFARDGALLVSVPRQGGIVRLAPDTDGNGSADAQAVLLTGLERPHGLDFHEGWLYVAESDAIGRVRYDAASGTLAGSYARLAPLPDGGMHWSRTLAFGPDGGLYVSIGSTCNACQEQDPRRAALLRFQPDGSGQEIYASGLRNAVGFDWRPDTNELYATDNGRDLLGDDFPPCELDRVVRGGFYGWPFANGNRVPDPDLGAGHEAEIATSIPPAHGFRAHNAPLGMRFLRGAALPPELRGAAAVALHGSWNRSRKDGYKVVSLHWDPDGSIHERDLVWGFLRDEDVIGRPVDVTEGPDGAVYVSDDYAGAVYRISYAARPNASLR